jgi:hypothetical protein
MYLDLDQRTGSRNMGGGVVFKVRTAQESFGPKWRVFTQAEPKVSNITV